MRVLIISGIFPPDIGGPATHAAELRTELLNRGHHVQVLTLTNHARRTQADGVIRFPRRWAWPLRSAAALAWMTRHARSFDVVYATGLGPVAVAGSLLARRPVVLKIVGDPAWERGARRGFTTESFDSFQSSQNGRLALRGMRGVRNWSVRKASAVIAPSAHLAQAVQRWGPRDDVIVVPNGARAGSPAIGRRTERPPGLDVVFVGRLVPVKQVDVILDAVARVDAVRLEIIGAGPELDALRRHAAALGIERLVTFSGAMNHERVLDRLAASDVLVMASEHEGLPHVVLEALVSGTPVVAGRAGGVGEVVTDGVDALLSTPTADGLEAALRRLVDEPGLLETLRSGAAATGGNWGFDRCAVQIETVLRSVTHRRPKAVFAGKSKLPLPPRPEDVRKYEINERYVRTTLVGTATRGGVFHPGGATVLAMPALGIPVLDTAAFYTLAPVIALALTVGRSRTAIVCQSPYEAFGVVALCSLLPDSFRPRVQVELHGDWRSATRLYGSPRRRFLSSLADRGATWALRQADRVRPVSDVLADLARSAGYEGPIDRHVAFSDYEEFLGTDPITPPERPHVLFVGVLERYKALDVLLDAWPSVVEALPDAHLTIVGTGRLGDELRRRVGNTDLASSVRVLDPMSRPELRRLIDASSCLVLPSRSEGLPRIVLESMARGRAIIASRVGGLAELVEDGLNGRLVAAEDTQSLARAITETLTDRSALEAMGIESRSRAVLRDPAREYEQGISRLAEWIDA